MSGLGFPPDLYCQNANECMNSVVKRGAQKKKVDIADCVEHLRRQVLHQQNTISRGELSVAEEFVNYQVDEDDFFKMTETQKNKAFQKFCAAPLTREVIPEAERHEGSDAQSSPDEVMSIGPAETCITSIPQTILKEMFVEASCMLKQDDSLHQFGNDDRSYYVNDGTRRGSASHVKIRQQGEVLCEQDCIRWASYRLCSHDCSGRRYKLINKETKYKRTRIQTEKQIASETQLI